MKADQHAALFRDKARADTGTVTIAPGFAVDRRVQLLGSNTADVPEIVFKYALLGSNLGRMIQMLHAATTADAKVGASRLYPAGRFAQDARGLRYFVGGFFPEAGILDLFARQGAFNENGFPFVAGNATGFVVQRFDNTDGHDGRLKSKKPISLEIGFL
jgi:hypothetical protein